jgi:alpha-tubulin suppressor-like RCC1 family protein
MASLQDIYISDTPNGYGNSSAGFILPDGRVVAWGSNRNYALGTGDNPTNPIYLPLANGRTAKAVAFTGTSTVVVCDNGTVQVSGINEHGQLGTGNTSNVGAFTTVSLANGKLAKKVVFATTTATYILCTDGTIQGTGSNGNSSIVGWTSGGNKSSFTHCDNFDGINAVDIASCTGLVILDTNNNIWCSGNIGPFNSSLVQKTLPSGNTPSQIFAGGKKVFVICTNGNSFLIGSQWGQGIPGGLSNVSTFTDIPMPSGKVPKWFGLAQDFSLMITTDNKVYGTGMAATDGGGSTLGNGSPNQRTDWFETTSLKAGRTPIAVYGSVQASYLIYDDGSIQSTGRNDGRQLGNGTTTGRTTFGDIAQISGQTLYAITNIARANGDPTVSDLNAGNIGKTSDTTITAGSRSITAKKLTKSAGAVSYAPDAVNKPSVAISNIPASVQDVTVGVASTDASGVAIVKIVAQDAENNLITDFSASPLTVRVTLPGFTSAMVTVQTSATIGGAVTDTITGYRVGTNLYEFTTTHLTYFSASAYVPCLVAGTRVLTASGYKAVEDLKAGDLIRTADNRITPFRMFTTTISATSPETAPYTIPARTFGASPAKDLTVSPYHAIQSAPGVWQIPKYASRMFEGITQAPAGQPITYYHLELPNYFKDNLVVEGTVTESYGNRQTVGMKTVYKFNPEINGFVRMQKTIGAKKSMH